MSKRVSNKRGKRGPVMKFNKQYSRERRSYLWNCRQKGIKPKGAYAS